MKKPILRLQFRPSPTAEHEVECIKKAMELSDAEIEVRNVTSTESTLPKLEELKNYSAFIFGASSDYNVTDWTSGVKEKCMATKYIYDYALEHSVPTLGICFGHQLIAIFANGKVERDATQSEGGVVEVQLNEVGIKSKIFEDFEESFFVSSGHKDSVTKLPHSAVKLASSKATDNSVFKIQENIFCIQQHPELDVDGLVWRLSLFPEYTRGRSMEEIKNEFQPMPYAAKFLKNFKKLIS